MNKDLVSYIENEIIPRYDSFDKAHQRDHVLTVIQESIRLAKIYRLNLDIVYAAAAYHDTGLSVNRETHHLVSGEIIRNDKNLKFFFNSDEIETIAEAAEDHRASSKYSPRSIYGKIIAEADRNIDAKTIVRRTIQYGLSHYPELTKDGHYERFCLHMKEKFAKGGYLKLWIPESRNAKRLEDFQSLLEDPQATKVLFDKEWNDITQTNDQ